MFGELPKLFDRNFAVGFFLPVGIFITLSGVILNSYPFGPDISVFLEIDLLIGTTILGLLSWIGGIVLLAVNRDLYRFMEGYGSLNPVKLFGWFEKRRYRNTLKELDELNTEYRACIESEQEFPTKSRQKRNKIIRRLSTEFPDKEELLLPTPFGNALRSFEIYPRAMYGLDSIDAWGRLLAVMPKDYVELVNSARSQVDFWVNLGLVFILLQIEYLGLAIATGAQLNWGIVVLWIVLGAIAPLRATSSAREWGDYVKSSFDVFAPKLRETLGIEPPKNREEEFAQWQKFSQAIIYRLPNQMPELRGAEEGEEQRPPKK
ncbi:MAG: hypothetical protein ISR58_13925 [Anaerolineales bacterium]|nr:hypothetical protein [Chloroflexota bacterium]MBL6982276.1 hypothetical protein [Anaerolineales bacterium]